MALADILKLSSSMESKKVGLSKERIQAIIPTARQYISFWREYPDIFVEFLAEKRTKIILNFIFIKEYS